MSRPIPDALLERYLAGDLPEAKRQEIEALLAASPAEQARVDALRADSAAFFVAHPPAPLIAKLESSRPSRRWLSLLMPAFGAVAALLVAIIYFVRQPTEDEYGVKGTIALSVFREAQTGQGEMVPPGATLKPGDKVRFEVRAPKDGWVAVLSKDGAGRVTIYYPFGGTAAVRYQTSEAMLPGAIGLDETPGAETAWVLYGPRPFTLQRYVDTLEHGDMLVSTDEVTVSRATWVKAAP